DFAVEVYVHETDKTNAVGLIEEAKEYIEEYDEVWAVFDKNGYSKHREAFEMADSAGVNIAFSSIAFEHWILLHFEKCSKDFKKSHDVEIYICEEKKYLDIDPDKLKKGDTDIYPHIQKFTKIAIENAAWLRYIMREELIRNDNKIYCINPFTDVDRLVSKLFGFDTEIIWGTVKEKILVECLELEITNIENKEDSISIEISLLNKKSSAFSVNQNTKFFLRTPEGEGVSFKNKPSLIIIPGEVKAFSLIFPVKKLSPGSNLIFTEKNHTVIIDL
ncbi:MAG: RloB domain-containing protein, partial [bacterium]|nr:RloB domain-containing protein [bacterium]